MHNTVTILASRASVEMSVASLRDIFVAAERAATRRDASLGRASGVKVVTEDGGPVSSFSGALIHPDGGIDDVESTRLIAIAGVWGNGVDDFAGQDRTSAWLVKHYQLGSLLACHHSGAFLLARTGLLDGKPACIYWQLEAAFRRRYPKVILQSDRKITEADRIYCASGIGSSLTLGVYLIEQLYGSAIANKVSRNFLMEGERQTDGLHLAFDRYRQHADDKVLSAQTWLENHLASDFLIEELADRLGLSLRTFMARFRRATGVTVLAYLQLVRIETAKRLLLSTRLTVDHIAYRVGYRDASHFGRLFKRLVGLTPGEFRDSSAT